jgi:hypothetical protein
MLTPRIVIIKATPGKVANHHETNKYARPSANIPPQLGVGGCIPNPKKLNADSIKIIRAISNVAITIHEAATFGNKCVNRILKWLTPNAFAAVINSLSLNDNTSDRTIRAYTTHPVIPNTTIIFLMFAPNTATTAMINNINGNANCTSANRIKILSTHPR